MKYVHSLLWILIYFDVRRSSNQADTQKILLVLTQIIRDTAGLPEVLTRLEAPASPLADSVTEYES